MDDIEEDISTVRLLFLPETENGEHVEEHHTSNGLPVHNTQTSLRCQAKALRTSMSNLENRVM